MKLAEAILEKKCDCWDGYKRVPNTEPCEPNSCMKESSDLKTLIEYFVDWFEADSDNVFVDWDIDSDYAYLDLPKKQLETVITAIAEDYDLDASVIKPNLSKFVNELEGLELKNKIKIKGQNYRFSIEEVKEQPTRYQLKAEWEKA